MAWQAYSTTTIVPDGTAGVRIFIWYYDDADPANAGAGLGPQGTGTATASTNLINITGHGLAAGQMIIVTAITGGAPLALNTPYYVIAAGLTANVFSVSAVQNGTVVDITANATSLTARKVTPPTVVLHERAWTLPRAGDINDLLPEIDETGRKARAAYAQAAALNVQVPIGTTRPVPA